MAVKMKELMGQSGDSKSTILFYVKEGLLPEPVKPKPNVHLYDESCVQILKFIKYLQHNFSYSIAEIQSIFQDNHFDFDSSFEMMVRSLELISGGRDNVWYTQREFLTLLGMNEKRLQEYQEKGYLFERAKGFSFKEVEVESHREEKIDDKAIPARFQSDEVEEETQSSIEKNENENAEEAA